MPIFRKKGKYRNIRCQCWGGHLHDSKFEAQYCDRLDQLKKAEKILDFKIHVPYEFKINGIPVCKHYVDFEVIGPDGSVECHDTKGVATAVWRLKHKLFLILYPDIPYKVIRRSEWS